MKKLFRVLLLALVVLGTLGFAQRVLRVDEVAVGELDPAKATDYADSMLMFNIYDTLVWANSEGDIIPLLAEKWAISKDGLTYTFTLRKNVKFHDGSEVTAEDVAYSFDRTVAINLGYAYLYKGWVKSVKVVDKYNVAFTLSESYAPFLSSLVRLPIVNKAVVTKNQKDGKFGANGDYGQAFLSANDAGSGAYKVDSHNPQEATVLSKFKDYFQGFAAKAPDQVRIRYSVEAATMRTLMSRNEHEVASQWLPLEVVKALTAAGKQVVLEAADTVFYLKFNTKKAPTDDVNLRKAMALAFDYDALRSILKLDDKITLAKTIRGPLPEDFPNSDKTLPLPKRDLTAAKAALAQSKYKSDQVVEIAWVAEVPLEEKFALLFQQNMAEIGVKVNVVKVPWALMTERASKIDSTPHVSSVYVAISFPDADSLLYSMYHSKAAGTWMSTEWLQDKQVDQLLDDARSETDPAKRKALYAQLQKRVVSLQPAIFAYGNVAAFVKQPYVKVPTLEGGSKSVAGIMAGNWIFRLIEVDK